MATKLPDEQPPTEAIEDRKPLVFLRVPAGEIKGVEIGDEITATFRGKVRGIDIHKDDDKTRANVDLEDPSVGVKKMQNQLSKLDEDLDDES